MRRQITIEYPMIITSRLLAGVRFGESEVSIEIDGFNGHGRTRYRWYIDGPGVSATGNDLMSGVGGGDERQGMASLLSFLGAASEAMAYERTGRKSDNGDLFPKEVMAWADANSDELFRLSWEIEENQS